MSKKNFNEKIDISGKYSRHLVSGKVTATAGIRNPTNLTMVYGMGANRIEVLRLLEKQNKFRLIWYITFLVLGIVCFIITPQNWFDFIRLVVLMINIDLVSIGKISGIYVGIAECLMYAFICFGSHLYGEVIKMFLINIPLNIFAIISWTKNLRAQKKAPHKPSDEKENSVVVRKLSVKNYWWMILLLGVLYVGCFFLLKLLNTSALWFSAGVLACTVYQKVLNGMCYKENWWFQILANIISIFMWAQVIITASLSGSINLGNLINIVATLAQLANGFYGYSLWKSMYRKIAVNGGEILAVRKVKIKKIIKLRHQYQKLLWKREIDEQKNS